MNKPLFFVVDVINKIALVCILISSVCMIEEIFKYIFQPENTTYAFFFHLYGFLISNLVALVMPQVKEYVISLGKFDEK